LPPNVAVEPAVLPERPSRARRLRSALTWLASALLGLYVLYVVAVNSFLNFGFFLLFEGTNSVNATLGRALSFWPGTAYVRDARIVFQDKNLQWTLDIASATVDVDMIALAQRTFHATSVKGEGAVFRMRHRVDPWGLKEPATAALTQIPEFPGPAVFEATAPEAPLTEATYNLWTVHLEDVDVGVSEAWVQQFRYVGGGRAKGKFRLRPARTLWVGPASLDLDGGRFTAGKYVISPKLSGRLEVVVEPFDVQVPTGVEVFRFISAGVELRGPELSLAVSKLFAPEGPALSAKAGELSVNARTNRGVLVPGSVLTLKQTALDVRHPAVNANAAQTELVAQVKPNGRGEAALLVKGAAVTLEGSTLPITVETFAAALESSSADTTAEWSLTGAELRDLRAKVADMRSFDGYLTRAGWSSSGGATELAGHASYRDGTLAGKINAVFDGVGLRSGDTALELDAQASLESERASLATWSGVASARLSNGSVRLVQDGSVFRAGGLEVEAHAQAEQGQGSAHVKVALANVGVNTGSVRVSATGNFDGKLEDWNLPESSGNGAVRGELRNLRLTAPEAEFELRAKRATIKSAQRRTEVGADANVSQLTLDTTLSDLTFMQGDGVRGQAREFALQSQLFQRVNGALDGTLRSHARGLEADIERMRFRADTRLHADAKGVDRQKNTGEVRADLSFTDFAAIDLAGDADCPWSTIQQANVLGLARMRGAEGTHFDVNAVLQQARLAWGDFTSTLEKARLATSFGSRALDEQKGKVEVALDVEAAKLVSGTKATSGWQASVPSIDFDATLQRQKGVLGGPMRVRADNVAARIGKTTLEVDLAGDVGFAQLDLDKQHATGAGRVHVRGLNLSVPGRKISDWWADVELPFVDLWAKENLDGIASFRASMRDALPALSVLAAEDDLPGWVPSIFPLRDLTAEGSVRRRCRLTEFQVSQVAGGPFVAVGRMQSDPDAVRGAFLVRLAAAHPISAGIRFDAEDSGVTLLAGSGWLKERYEPLERLERAAETELCIPPPRACGN
jgi:hypothetical protein